jgi:hypothetical protein
MNIQEGGAEKRAAFLIFANASQLGDAANIILSKD